MSADAASLPCPICLHTGVFNSAQSLKDRLIYVSTNKILCPVCQEEVSGLDKLTIHLFSHVKIIAAKEIPKKLQDGDNKLQAKSENACVVEQQQKKSRISVTKNKTPTSMPSVTPVKYVKIYPKLPVIALNTMPVIDISHGSVDACMQNGNSLYLSAAKNDSKTLQVNNKCDICGIQFVDADILRMHKCLIHNLDNNTEHSFTRYNCHLCPKNFKMRGSLMVHLRVAHFGFSSNNAIDDNVNNTIKGKDINQAKDTSLILERNDGKQWQCDVCRKCFTTKYFLKKHKRLHTGETPYACTQCNKTFTFQQSYHKHLLYHNDEKPHTCTFCGRAFKELSTLHNHQRIHTGEKPFSCETCGKCFRQRVSYLVHRRIHTGAMPYKCTACNKSFRYKVSQRTHKCQAQPPGTVIRKTGDLVEKLKKKHPDSVTVENTAPKNKKEFNKDITYVEVSEANAELVRTGAKISLEDMESDNFNIIAESFDGNNDNSTPSTSYSSQAIKNEVFEMKDMNKIDSNIKDLIDSLPVEDKNVPSPSDILKNLCLSTDEELNSVLEELM
ncbi:uncharacterized protein [Epargyreus clarus]|uniref:uncharacterized protein n=1 Tax=Epargyreus clarus TaxID=520877 RepID=UPI003C302ED2